MNSSRTTLIHALRANFEIPAARKIRVAHEHRVADPGSGPCAERSARHNLQIVCHGDDYTLAQIAGHYGTIYPPHRLVLVPCTAEISTSAILARIRQRPAEWD